MLISRVLTAYAERKTNLKRSSLDQIGYSVRALECWLGGPATVQILTETVLARFARERLQEVSASTAKRNLADVVGLLRFAAKRLNSGVSVPEVESVRIPRKIPVAWTVRQVAAILRQCETLTGTMRSLPIQRCDWWRALILLCYDTGARLNAALSVEVAAVDLDARIVVLAAENAKTGIEQVCDLGEDTCAALSEVIRQQVDAGIGPGLLLPYPWRRRRLWLELQQLIDAANVPGGRYVGFHRLRKTHATQRVIQEGWDAARLALGHANQKMTERYVDLRQLPRAGAMLPRPK